MSENLKHLDDLGSPNTYNHYPTGWAMAFSTPFRMFKRYSYQGGVSDPLVIHWPKGIKAKGEVRHQYHHSIDIVPTILECVGLEFPKTLNGHEQVPLPGDSMRYSFDAADAPTPKKRQYYAMLGTRGIWEDGWKAVTVHGPTSGLGHFDDDVWQLFHTDVDRSEAHDLAAEEPEKLKQLIAAWFEEADKYNVLPLDDRFPVEIINDPRPQPEPPRDTFIYYPDTADVPESVAANVRGRSFRILADVDIATPEASGVIFAHGSRFGGHALFLKDQKLWYVYNFLGIPPEQQFVSDVARARQVRPGRGVHQGVDGPVPRVASAPRSSTSNDEVVATGPMRTQIGIVHAVRRRPVHRARLRRRRERRVHSPRSASPAGPSTRSRSTSATTSTSTSSGTPRRCSPASDPESAVKTVDMDTRGRAAGRIGMTIRPAPRPVTQRAGQRDRQGRTHDAEREAEHPASSGATTSAGGTRASTTTGRWATARRTSTASAGKARCSPTGTGSRAAPPAGPRSSPASRRSGPG